MDYRATLDYLLHRLPMFQRQGAAAYRANLDNSYRIAEILGNPHQRLKCIHIAGTNGKGSVTHWIASVLQHAGYKVGIYSSPHYLDYRERIKINGTLIPEETVTEFVAHHQQKFETLDASFFEITTGMAFWYFEKEKVDFAVIETGLGGRLDCTNIISPLLSVITNISFDHMMFLGDTLPQIAAEKAGIIKAKVPVVIGEKEAATASVFEQTATQQEAPLIFAENALRIEGQLTFPGDSFQVSGHRIPEWNGQYQSGLGGNFQLLNLRTALAALDQLHLQGIPLPTEAVQKGIAQVVQSTRMMGRFMLLNAHTLADSAHNEGGMKQLLESLKNIPHQNLRITLGFVADKALDRVLAMLPAHARYYFCKADLPRALPADELRQKALPFGLIGNTYSSVAEAYRQMQKDREEGDWLLITGSVFVVAEVLAYTASEV